MTRFGSTTTESWLTCIKGSHANQLIKRLCTSMIWVVLFLEFSHFSQSINGCFSLCGQFWVGSSFLFFWKVWSLLSLEFNWLTRRTGEMRRINCSIYSLCLLKLLVSPWSNATKNLLKNSVVDLAVGGIGHELGQGCSEVDQFLPGW